MKTRFAAPKLQPQERLELAKLWRADPATTRATIADRATRLLGRRVTEDQAKKCRPPDLVERRSGRPRHADSDAPPPEPRARRGLPYPTPLEALILEARAVRRRLGIGRTRKGVAA